MYPPHTYWTAFSSRNGQWQYLHMGQGWGGVLHTYCRLKGIYSGHITEPHAEKCLDKYSVSAFEYFINVDFGTLPSFRMQFDFLHNNYFPRLAWAKITLKATKCRFFIDKIDPLGFSSDGSRLRHS